MKESQLMKERKYLALNVNPIKLKLIIRSFKGIHNTKLNKENVQQHFLTYLKHFKE